MIAFLDLLMYLFSWIYRFIFFWILYNFLPLRKQMPVRILALLAFASFSNVIVYLNDLDNILMAACAFSAYVAVFHRGNWIEKVTTVLVFYPTMIAVNFMMLNISSEMFFAVTDAAPSIDMGWSQETEVISSLFYMLANFIRLLFWIGAGLLFRKKFCRIITNLTTEMWLIVDALMVVSSVAVFTTIYFVTDTPIIVYPVCTASILSSFGCIYLVSYMSNSAQIAQYAQKLEMQQNYYQEKLKEEERVRAIYHDMKNHLLVLESQGGTPETARMAQQLREQLAEYEDYVSTGNSFLDIILKEKARCSREKQIDFSAVVDFQGIDFMEPLDISILFGNGIDNAIEASERLPEEQRVVLVKAGRIHNFLSILIENNCTAESAVNSVRTSKEDSFLHGFGIVNMKKTAEKYGGRCNIENEFGKFKLKILIPIP